MPDDHDKLPSWYLKIREKNEDVDISISKNDDYIKKAQNLFALALSRKSSSTIKVYQHALSNFASFVKIDNGVEALAWLLSLDRIDAQTKVLQYLAWMEESGLSPATMRSRLAALKFYVATAHDADWVDWEISVKGPPQENVKEITGPTEDEFKKILNTVSKTETFTQTRNKLLVYMLSFMGLRVSEVLGMDFSHVDLEKKRVFVLRKGSKVQRQWRSVPTETMLLIEDYLELRGMDDGPFFLTAGNSDRGQERFSRFAAYKTIRKIGEKAGIKNLHPHAFRHFSVTQALEITDGNEHKVMRHSGHKTRKMIDIYDDQRKDEAGEVAKSIEDKWIKK